MNRTIPEQDKSVSEKERRYWTEEYRREGYKRQAMPHMVYQNPFQLCPWEGCGFRIASIDFQLEKISDRELKKALLAAWWQGPGFVGRCPRCGQYVLYSMDGKQVISDSQAQGFAMLPDDWYQNAFVPE
jgi:hypothetical protein